MNRIKVILIPGNGGGTPHDNWFPYLEHELPEFGIVVINKQFPDPVLAREEFWLSFIKELGADENTILIGHSSGAIAAMRFAEKNRVLGSVLVGAYYTDLGDESEEKSGYFNRPWNWKTIRDNQKWTIQFSSTDDPFIPIEEPRFIHQNLDTYYHECTNQKHFGYGPEPKLEFPELVDALAQRLQNE